MKLCVPNKTEDLNLNAFNMITEINELKALTKHISCECKFYGGICNLNQWWNNDKFLCKCKKHFICQKYYIWNPVPCSCENEKYLATIMDDSVIMCNETIEETVPEKLRCKTKNLYILLALLLITIAFFITLSIYCYLIKY